MTDDELIAAHIRNKGVTLIAPGPAAGLTPLEKHFGMVSKPENPVPWRQRVHNQISRSKQGKAA